MNLELNKILKYIIIVLLILLAILSVTYKFDSCSHCNFEVNNTNYNIDTFMILYSNKCLDKEPFGLGNLNIPELEVVVP